MHRENRLRRDHAEIRHEGLGEHAGDIARGQGLVERRDVVELDDPRDLPVIHGIRVDAVAQHGLAAAQRHMRLLDRAVIAAVEDQNLRTPVIIRRCGSRRDWRRWPRS